MSGIKAHSVFRMGKGAGVVAILVHKGKVLVMKRIWLPFILHPGIWTFPAGRIDRGESDRKAVYREVLEETGIDKGQLALLGRYPKIMKVDKKGRNASENTVYVFRSKTGRIRMNIENTAYRWATLSDIANERHYTNIFANPAFILKVIRKALEK
jgi:8-oxo-dGTP pyrophosphatase MutT (NUDIX family)